MDMNYQIQTNKQGVLVVCRRTNGDSEWVHYTGDDFYTRYYFTLLIIILFLCTEEIDGIAQLSMQKIVRLVDTLWLLASYEKDGVGQVRDQDL